VTYISPDHRSTGSGTEFGAVGGFAFPLPFEPCEIGHDEGLVELGPPVAAFFWTALAHVYEASILKVRFGGKEIGPTVPAAFRVGPLFQES
jgi:hypothetical protein